MASMLKLAGLALALTLAQAASASAVLPGARGIRARAVDESCEHTYVRKPWAQLTDADKTAYLDAEVCLQEAAAQGSVEGAQTRWDELMYTHIAQEEWIHFVGAFLPWHRYFVHVHNKMLKDECGYTGAIPYWDETTDYNDGMASNDMFTDAYFGGDGNDGDGGCVTTGRFANLTLRLTGDGYEADGYCLTRAFDQASFGGSSQSQIDTCLAYTTFSDMWNCIEGNPHRSGHSALGGQMIDVASSPGEPVFYMHHTFVDSLWARWQAEDPSNRTYWIDGANVQSNYNGDQLLAFTAYDGDDGNTTTLNHVLWMAGLADNITVSQIMNISNELNCAEYVYLS